jgi:hypothetical protein
MEKNLVVANAGIIANIKAELDELDNYRIDVHGKRFIASQCYRFFVNPVVVLFNSNCPESIKQKVQSIVSRYIPGYENLAIN